MSLPHLKEDKLYGNCKVLHPDGTLMFLCARKRANWYLNRNLGIIISDNPFTIQLSFTPKGKGNSDDPYYINGKENHCVVCGSKENLTKHHVVPHCFRKHFPENIKSRSSHDVVIVCVDCHQIYEKPALELKKQLASQHNIDLNHQKNDVNFNIKKAKNYVRSIISHGKNIPNERKEKINKIITLLLGKEMTYQEVLEITESIEEIKDFSEVVVSKCEDLKEFIKMWREHFV